ncbi:MAG: carbohydrate kinase family protein [Candidatus Bathyarchaeia archaeon]
MNRQTANPPHPNLTFIGHISIDKIENINGTKTQPGGAALYAAIAAKALNLKPAIVSAIGKDFPYTDSFDSLDSTYIKKFNMPTTRFHIRYSKNWEANYLEAHINAGARIATVQIPQKLLTPQSIIHLSPMSPTKVAKIVDRVKQMSPSTKIALSTWVGYMKEPRNRRLLTKLASVVDFFMLNESEAKTLTQTSSLSMALEKIKAPKLVVTMGKLGAIISGTNVDPQIIPALTVPTNKTIDTTGAGDAWNGAFLATYITTEDLMKSVTVASVISSIKCSQWGFKALQKLSFQKPSDVVEHIVALKEGSMQKKITDFKMPKMQ